METPSAARDPLAVLLAEEQAAPPDQLQKATRAAHKAGLPLWAILADSGVCNEELLYRVLSRRTHLPVMTPELLNKISIPQDLKSLFPAPFVERFGILPLRREGRQLAMAMVDPISPSSALQTVLRRAGYGVSSVHLIHGGVLRRHLPRLYPRDPHQQSPTIEIPRPAALSRRAPSPLPLSDQPTGMVNLPDMILRKARTRHDEPTALMPGRQDFVAPVLPPLDTLAVALTRPPQPAAPRSLAITQPLQPVSTRPSNPAAQSVQVDPALYLELEGLRGSVANERAEGKPLAPRPLEMPQVLQRSVRALVIAMEERLLGPGVPSSLDLAAVVEGAAREQQVHQTQAGELGLLGLLYGVLRMLLDDEGQQPPPLSGELGWVGEDGFGLGACLHDLQYSLAAREPALLLRGQRLLSAALLALRLIREGALPDDLQERLSTALRAGHRALGPGCEGPQAEDLAAVGAVLRRQFQEDGAWSPKVRPHRSLAAPFVSAQHSLPTQPNINVDDDDDDDELLSTEEELEVIEELPEAGEDLLEVPAQELRES